MNYTFPENSLFASNFSLEGIYLSKDLIKNVEINYTQKKLIIYLYETCDKTKKQVLAHVWAENMRNNNYPDEKLNLTTYDGGKNKLYSRCFKNLKIIEEKHSFNYCSFEFACYVVSVSFENYENN